MKPAIIFDPGSSLLGIMDEYFIKKNSLELLCTATGHYILFFPEKMNALLNITRW